MGARRFLADGLRQLVEASGLEVEEILYWNSWLTPLLWLQIQIEALGRRSAPAPAEPAEQQDGAGPSELRLPPAWLNRGLAAVLDLERQLSPLLPLPWGSSLMLVARKPLALAPH